MRPANSSRHCNLSPNLLARGSHALVPQITAGFGFIVAPENRYLLSIGHRSQFVVHVNFWQLYALGVVTAIGRDARLPDLNPRPMARSTRNLGSDAALLHRGRHPRGRSAAAGQPARRCPDAPGRLRTGHRDRPRTHARAPAASPAGGSAPSSAPATTAATRCGRRPSCGAAGPRPPPSCSTRTASTPRRWRRSPRAGGRIVESVPAATDLVIDGVVGISGSGPLRPDAAEVFAAVDAPASRSSRSTSPAARRPRPAPPTGRTCSAALTVTFGGLKPVHALGDCGRVELVDIGLDLPRRRPGRASRPPTSPRAGRCPGRATTSTPRASPACWPARRPIRARRSCAPAPPSPPRRAWCATREARQARWSRTGPRSSPRRSSNAAGRVQAWVVGPGLGTDEAGAAALWFALDTDLPVIVDADGADDPGRPPRPGRRPHRADRADAARGRVRAAGRVTRPATTASPPPAGWPTRFGATVLLKGNVTVDRRARSAARST